MWNGAGTHVHTVMSVHAPVPLLIAAKFVRQRSSIVFRGLQTVSSNQEIPD
jgi:hypothetical protein